MRDLLKQNLARSLESFPELDRLQTAWPVACGSAMAHRATLTAYHAGVVTLHVTDPAWRDQFHSMRSLLARDLARIAGLPVHAIHLVERVPKP